MFSGRIASRRQLTGGRGARLLFGAGRRAGCSRMRIAFVHPDLGIGGAERLVVDAAVGLKRVGGHDVTIYTSHHDPGHAFAETCDGAVDVVVYGDFLPISLGGRFKIACALLRSVYLACRIVLRGQWPDLVFFDQVRHMGPLPW